MAVNKNFVVKNGLEVSTDLIIADSTNNRVGVGTTVPEFTLEVNGGIGATDVKVSGFSTLTDGIHAGIGGTVFSVISGVGVGASVGVGTANPRFLLDVRSIDKTSTGTTALYVQGDARITGDLNLDDIIIDDATGNNAIIVVIEAAGLLGPEHVEQATSKIAEASVFMTNFEVSSPSVKRGLEIARAHSIPTILNPAPATEVPLEIFALADYVTPNETEASSFTGIQVNEANDARKAALKLREMGVGTALITLGEKGCYVLNDDLDEHIPAFDMTGKVVETTGAGDAFNGGFAHALASGQSLRDAVRFGSATAARSVTKPGTAPAMPSNTDIQSLLNTGTKL